MASKGPYRLSRNELMLTLGNWDSLMNFRVRLVSCGGTALTLLGLKESTKDVDFLVPVVNEFKRLMHFLSAMGYREREGGWTHPDDSLFVYQFWHGNRVFSTELLESPLEQGNHIPIRNWRHLHLAALNLSDLIITKMFRGSSVDLRDCIAVFATGQVDPEQLQQRFEETAKYDLNPEKMMDNFRVFARELVTLGLVEEAFLQKIRSSQ